MKRLSFVLILSLLLVWNLILISCTNKSERENIKKKVFELYYSRKDFIPKVTEEILFTNSKTHFINTEYLKYREHCSDLCRGNPELGSFFNKVWGQLEKEDLDSFYLHWMVLAQVTKTLKLKVEDKNILYIYAGSSPEDLLNMLNKGLNSH